MLLTSGTHFTTCFTSTKVQILTRGKALLGIVLACGSNIAGQLGVCVCVCIYIYIRINIYIYIYTHTYIYIGRDERDTTEFAVYQMLVAC